MNSAAVESGGGGRIFRRMTLRQRGHFPNTLRFRPVLEIALDATGISLIRSGKQFRYQWPEIRRAAILTEESFKGYGRAASGRFVKRTFVMEAIDGHRFAFDVSEDFPDFEKNDDLLRSLREYLAVSDTRKKPFSFLPWVLVAMAILLAGIALKKCGL
jgi:hypothetical protein